MKESPEEGQYPNTDTSIPLQFPTIPVDGTPANWLSHSHLVAASIKMSSQHDDSSCEETTSSLGDSNYDFIDDRSIATTDDDEEEVEDEEGQQEDLMTESTTSSDGHDIGQHSRPDEASHKKTGDSPSSPKTPTHNAHQGLDKNFDSRIMSSDQPESTDDDLIVFEEPSVINVKSAGLVDVSHQLRSLDMHGTWRLMNLPPHVQPSRVSVAVQQTMTSHGLDLKSKAYRVFCVGPPTMREAVIQKIGAALAATHREIQPSTQDKRASRFNVVPISAFGDSQNPEVVLIDSSGLELSVDECSWVTAQSKEGSQSIELTLSDGRLIASSWNGSELCLSDNWEVPDIAVFCLPERKRSEVKMYSLARKFMSRHQVKSVVITEDSYYDFLRADESLDNLTPHLCLEHYHPNGTVLARWRLPVNLAAFLNIDAGQLNRNLACIASTTESLSCSQSAKHDQESLKPWGLESVRKTVREYPYKSWNAMNESLSLRTLVFLVIFMTIYSSFLVSTIKRPSPLEKEVASTSLEVSPSATSPSVTLTAKSQCNAMNSGPESPTSILSQTLPLKSLSTDTAIASYLMDAYASPPNRVEQFKVHVLGDSHIILRPPHWLTKMKKAPQLSFEVSSRQKSVGYQVSTLFDGVYALRIPREEAYGLLNVKVRTESRPLINESFDVDFGSSWLKVAAWKRATRALTDTVQHDLVMVQSSLSTVYSQTKNELSIFVKTPKERMSSQNHSRHQPQSTSPSWGAQTRAMIVAQSKDISRILSDKLHNGRKETSKQMYALSKDLDAVSKDLQDIRNDIRAISGEITQRLMAPVRLGIRTVSAHTRLALRMFPRAVPGRSVNNTMAFKAHYRKCQKEALKMWWKIRGVPLKPEPVVETKRRVSKFRGLSS